MSHNLDVISLKHEIFVRRFVVTVTKDVKMIHLNLTQVLFSCGSVWG